MFPKMPYTEAAQWADEILSEMTLEEKCAYVGGDRVFFTQAIERLGISPILFSDATAGVVLRDRFYDVTYQNPLDQSTAFPAPICLAATWNPELAEQYASAIAEQCKANGIGVLLGPGFNLYRVSQCGRNFEYFGEDPFLIARLVERYVQGVQNQGVIATLKHFVANNTDYFRRKSNSVVDERTLREIYLPAFKAGIDAGAMAVMTSYNLLNGEWTGQSRTVIHDLLRQQLGFKWLVMSDWWSVYDAKKIARSGLDLEMPAGEATARFAEQVSAGDIAEEDVDRMVKSLLTTFKAMDLYEQKPQPELKKKFPQHEKVALQTAREGIVLLRNEKRILPLNPKQNRVLLLGDGIVNKASGGGSSFVKGYQQVTQLQALKEVFGEQVEYQATPTDEAIRSAERIIVSVGTQDAESWDRPFALDVSEELYLRRIVGLNANVIVLVNSGSGIRMTDWYQHTAAIVYCWYNGQNGNTALAEILSGQVNPSGRLPFTIEREFADGPGADYVPKGETLYQGANDEWEKIHPVYDVNYKEGVFVGYRWYEKQNIEPLYPFGYGLTYTQFDYATLQFSHGEITQDDTLSVSFGLRNSGPMAGSEVAQVYVRDLVTSVPRPGRELKGFKKVSLKPGEHQFVSIDLPPSAFTFWCEKTHAWVAEPGEFEILVSRSAQDVVLKGTVTLVADKSRK